ncbi:MAG: pilV [Herminiimonas sp.]|nr:pilV [Herminiimonas sp.]
MMLLEALMAILIFSLGILAMVGMQAVAVKQVSDARYRSEASLLVNQLIGTMWVSDRATAVLQTNFNTGGTGYAAWLPGVSAALPGVAANPPTVVVDGAGMVTVTIFWLAPNEGAAATPHNYTSIAQIR